MAHCASIKAMAEEITIFTTPTCRECKAAKSFLSDMGVAFQEIDISKDGKARYRVKKMTGRTRTPVLVVDGKVIDGFDPVRLKPLLHPQQR